MSIRPSGDSDSGPPSDTRPSGDSDSGRPSDTRPSRNGASGWPSAFCPHCGRSLAVLADDGGAALRLAVVRGDEDGQLLIERGPGGECRATIDLTAGPPDAVLCPLCGAPLAEEKRQCRSCGGPLARLVVVFDGKARPTSFCVAGDCSAFGDADDLEAAREGAARRERAPRQRTPEQDAVLRVRNFSEVAYGFDRELAVLEAGRCLQCKKPTCIEACPVGVDIPGFIAQVKDGDFVGAARTIKQRNALPAMCGRVCPQDEQCEARCLLGKKEQPVAIGALERFAADFERETDQVTIPERVDPNGRRIAVVGSGPAGLTLAADLVVLGYAVTVYEALHKAGGVLAYGIPEFRLPKAIVEAEIGYLRRMGVHFELDTIVGKLYGLDELFDMGFDAVYLATGAGLPVFLGLPGENLCHVVSANEYLTRVNLMKAYLFPEYDTPAPRGTQVAVIGGGNVATDCARTALRMGSREVTIVYRRTREDMPARGEEIRHAEQEGVRFRYLTAPVRYHGDDQGWVRRLECVEMKLGDPDESGRRRPIPIAGSNFLLDVDLVLVAVGAGPNPTLFTGCPGLERDERGYIRVFDEAGRTSVPGVWAGGDIVTGSATVILAMGAARSAALDIDAHLSSGATGWPA